LPPRLHLIRFHGVLARGRSRARFGAQPQRQLVVQAQQQVGGGGGVGQRTVCAAGGSSCAVMLP
jgi:hypothetical protein